MSDVRSKLRSQSPIRTVIVEEKLLFAEALDIALSRDGLDVKRVSPGLHRSTSTLLTAVLRVRPSIALVDVDLDDTALALRLVTPLCRSGVAVLAMTATADSARWGECLRHGARTVLPMTCPLREVVRTVRLVSAGHPVIGRAERERLIADYHREKTAAQGARQSLDKLTNREREVLGHLRDGLTVAEIASCSCVSESTVRTQVRSILAKLNVTSQVAAVAATHRVRWNPPPVVSTRSLKRAGDILPVRS